MKDDLELVEQVLKGDINAFEEIIKRYEMNIVNFIYGIIKDKSASEDLTQEVFIVVYKKLYGFSKDCKFSTWLYQIAHNKAIDYVRKYKKYREIDIQEVSTTSKEMSPESFVEFKETKALVEQFINVLGDIDRQIVSLRYCKDDLTFKDIAEIMNMGESAVKKRYYKIYEKYERFVESKYSSIEKVSNNL